jgi:hypothetical protein
MRFGYQSRFSSSRMGLGQSSRVGSVRGHPILPGDGLLLVNVHLRESDSVWLGVFRREGFVSRSNGFARPTPVRVDC